MENKTATFSQQLKHIFELAGLPHPTVPIFNSNHNESENVLAKRRQVYINAEGALMKDKYALVEIVHRMYRTDIKHQPVQLLIRS